jgi:hypothetical protein
MGWTFPPSAVRMADLGGWHTGTTAPAPHEGMVWLDTSSQMAPVMKVWLAGSWRTLSGGQVPSGDVLVEVAQTLPRLTQAASLTVEGIVPAEVLADIVQTLPKLTQSMVVQVTTDAEVPQNLRVTVRTLTALTLRWDAVAGAGAYHLQQNGATPWRVGSPLTSLHVYNLPPGAVYDWRVRALFEDDMPGPWSQYITEGTLAQLEVDAVQSLPKLSQQVQVSVVEPAVPVTADVTQALPALSQQVQASVEGDTSGFDDIVLAGLARPVDNQKASGTSLTVPHPSTDPGHLLVAQVVSQSHELAQIPAGWDVANHTWNSTSTTTGMRVYVLVRPASPADSSTSFTWVSTGRSWVGITAWSGVDLSVPVVGSDGIWTSNSAMSVPVECPAVGGVTRPGSLALYLFGASNNVNRSITGGADHLTWVYSMNWRMASRAMFRLVDPTDAPGETADVDGAYNGASVTLALNPAPL